MSGPIRQQPLLLSRQVTSLCVIRHSACRGTPAHDTLCTAQSQLGQGQRRYFLEKLFGSRNKKPAKTNAAAGQNPFLQDILSRKPSQKQPSRAEVQGDLSAGSVFSTEGDLRPSDPSAPGQRQAKKRGADPNKRDLETISVVADPNPRRRETWQREMVARLVRKKERLTKAQYIKRTEREIVVKSPDFKTSVKKLGALARQIQGKTVQDALVQMQFSNKLAARDVKAHLEYTRDMAVVSRGMGIGGVTVADHKEAAPGGNVEIDILRKDGKKQTITDPSKLYIEQAWVGRGPYGKKPDYRARGQVNIMRPPHTHISIKLKEHATLVREYRDREEKKTRQRLAKPWVPLPDRPIQGQQQYYTW